MSEIRTKTISGLKAGEAFRVTRTFSEAEMVEFAGISRDYNPVHFDDRFAASKGFKGRICHGLLVAGMITEIGGQIGWLATGMYFDFKKPVFFGDTVRCDFTLTRLGERNRAEAEAVFTNQYGEVVIRARLTGFVPGREDCEVLSAMVAEGDPTNRLLRE